jgi:hypothetical protein
MRNLVYAINLSIDGCCDHTKMIGDEEIHEYFTQLLRDADLLVYGRITVSGFLCRAGSAHAGFSGL